MSKRTQCRRCTGVCHFRVCLAGVGDESALCGERRAWNFVTEWKQVTCRRCLALKGKR